MKSPGSSSTAPVRAGYSNLGASFRAPADACFPAKGQPRGVCSSNTSRAQVQLCVETSSSAPGAACAERFGRIR